MFELLRTACTPGIVLNALRIAAVVGTVLNIINQGEAVLQGRDPSWPHLLLNYVVPFCVASYSAAKHEIRRR